NFIYNTLIWLGIKGIILFNPKPKQEKTVVKSYVLMSESMNTALNSKLNKPVYLYSKDLKLSDHQQIIFDNQSVSFKACIDFILKSKREADLTYKILPKDTQFIIGSNSSKGRGEVITF